MYLGNDSKANTTALYYNPTKETLIYSSVRCEKFVTVLERTEQNCDTLSGIPSTSKGLPLVSFIIPVLNGERDIARCLSSIRHQKVPAETYEVLIIDNGSTDQTLRIVHDLGFDRQVVPNVHVSALRNRGVAMAKGDYIAFVDADVELTPDWLQNGLVVFEDQRVVANGCFPGVPPDATWVQRAWDAHQCRYNQTTLPWPVPWLPSMNLMVRRDDFLAVSGFNEHLETAEDVDLCYRLGQRGTILCNPAMKAIHWGEARDLWTFWRKEIWRGVGNLRGLWSHGLRWDELPSLGYPLYVLIYALFFMLAGIVNLWHGRVTLSLISDIPLVLPALLLACNTARLVRRPFLIPQLCLLYLVYGLARAYAIVKP
jgi:glycosyltransferase involved in cell wall biosynthesis